jgi:hypothetical protein
MKQMLNSGGFRFADGTDRMKSVRGKTTIWKIWFFLAVIFLWEIDQEARAVDCSQATVASEDHSVCDAQGSAADAAFRQGDYVSALRFWRPLANRGNASAQFDLGMMFQNGYGVARNYVTAAMWYRLAADQGNAEAQYNLAVLYLYGHGLGVPKDHRQAIRWFREAAARGSLEAKNSLARLSARRVASYAR